MMNYIETKTADCRVGRVCKLRTDWKLRTTAEDGKGSVVKAGAELLILPQLGVPSGICLDNMFQDFHVTSSLLYTEVNIEKVGKYIGETISLPCHLHQPTNHMLLDVGCLDWKSIVAIGRSYYLTDNILETLLAIKGLKQTFEFIQYFHKLQEQFVVVTCPACDRDSIIDVGRNLYCQNPGCEYKIGRDITASDLKKKFIQNPTHAVHVKTG